MSMMTVVAVLCDGYMEDAAGVAAAAELAETLAE
jgi:hypothetical protein